MFIKYIMPSVCLILSQSHQLSSMKYIYMGLCVFSRPIPLMMIVRIYVLYHILSSNQKRESSDIVKGYAIKQWYTYVLYVLLWS